MSSPHCQFYGLLAILLMTTPASAVLYIGTDDLNDHSPPLPSFDFQIVRLQANATSLVSELTFDALSLDDSQRYIVLVLAGDQVQVQIDCDVGRPNPIEAPHGRCAGSITEFDGSLTDLDPTQASQAKPLEFHIEDESRIVVTFPGLHQSLGRIVQIQEVYVGVQAEIGIGGGEGRPVAEVAVPRQIDEFLESTNFALDFSGPELNRTPTAEPVSEPLTREAPNSIALPIFCVLLLVSLARIRFQPRK